MILNEISFKSSMPIGQVHDFERNIVQIVDADRPSPWF
jgi:hypothetical protein